MLYSNRVTLLQFVTFVTLWPEPTPFYQNAPDVRESQLQMFCSKFLPPTSVSAGNLPNIWSRDLFLMWIQQSHFHCNWIKTDTDILQILKLSLCLFYLSYVIHSIHINNHRFRIFNMNPMVLLSLKSSRNWQWYFINTIIIPLLVISSYVIHYIHTYNHQIHIFNNNVNRNWVRIDADIPWILKNNQIHQNIPHLEYFPKKEPHPKCTAAIHPILPPNDCGKGGIINYQYTRPQISYFRSENQCQMHPTARSAEIDDVFYL